MVTPKADFTQECKSFPKVSELQIANTRTFFDMGMTAHLTYQQPGTPSKNVVQKLFNFWHSQYLDESNLNLTERQLITKGKMKEISGNFLFKIHYVLGAIEAQMEGERKAYEAELSKIAENQKGQAKPFAVNIDLANLYARLIKEGVEIASLINGIEASPTAYEESLETILDTIKQKEEELDKLAAENGIRAKQHLSKGNLRNKA